MSTFSAPILESQDGIWYAQALDPGNPTFNTGHYIEIKGKLNLPIFFMAAQQAIKQAQVLALRFKLIDDQPWQTYQPEQRPQQHFTDWRHQADARQQVLDYIEQDLAQPRDPYQDELVNIQLFAISEQQHIWYQRVHHLLTDGYGMLLLETQIAAYYNYLLAIEHGEPAPTVTPFSPYQAVLEANASYLQAAQRQLDRQFWQQRMASAGAVIPLKEGSSQSAHSYLRQEEFLAPDFMPQLEQFAAQSQVSWPDIITALTAVFLCRHSNTYSNIVGIPFMARLGQAAAHIPAMVMNVLPLPVQYSEDDSISQFCLELSKSIRQSRRHGFYRSEQLRRDLGLLGGQKRLYGALINVLPFDSPMQLDGLSTERQVLCSGPVDDLSISFRSYKNQQLILTLDANPKLYQAAELVQLQTRLQHFLTACLTADKFSQVATVTAAEWQHWIYGVNQTQQQLASTNLAALVAQQVQQQPQALALCDEQRQLSYAQFDQQVNRLCQHLAQQGVQSQDIVALLIERSIDLVLAIHATVRLGAIYLPLDTQHPAQRLSNILTRAKPRLLIGQNHSLSQQQQLMPGLKRLNIDQIDLSVATDLPALELRPIEPKDAAYIIFTSGSTGEPKGVIIEHAAIVNRLLWMQQHYQIGSGARILQKTPVTFDVSVWELFLPLISGATLVVAAPEVHKDPQALSQLVQRQQISIMHFVPSMLAAFLAETKLPRQSSLQQVFCSGEALPANLRDSFHQQLQAQLHNLYGPTEAAVDVSYWPADAHDNSNPVPIGFPVWNTQLYILDQCLRPVPPKVLGTLYIAGDQLARGYLGREDLTAQRFIRNPFAADSSAKMYDSGDLARWRDDGAVEFLGRSDFQVKIRGLRIELDEIQAVLSQHPSLANVAVIARQDQNDQAYLAAYLVPKPATQLDIAQLNQFAAQQLPDYMLPAAWVELTELPLTSSGKLDRKALPAPTIKLAGGRAPSSAMERELAALFQQLLQLEQPLSVEDDFFALGGHSLLAAQLVSRIRQQWQLELGLGIVFEYPSILRLANYLTDLLQRDAESKHYLSQHGMAASLRLQQAQNSRLPALFCLHPAGGIGWCYAALARELQQQPRTVYGIQAPTLDLLYPTPVSLQALARHYVEQIRQLQPQGPYHLAGWSVGGIIAQAMAVELQQQQQPVGLLALLDAYPSDIWQAKPEPAADAAIKAILLIAGFDPQDVAVQPLTQAAVMDFLRQKQHPLGELEPQLLAAIIRVVGDNNQLVRQHQQQQYHGEALYFRAALDHVGEDLQPQMWLPYIDQLQIFEVASLHGHMLNANNAKSIATALLQYFSRHNN